MEILEWENSISFLSSSIATASAEAHLVARNPLSPLDEDVAIPNFIFQSENYAKTLLIDFSSFISTFSFKVLVYQVNNYFRLNIYPITFRYVVIFITEQVNL